MPWLLYATLAAAQNDIALLDKAMGFPSADTLTWAVPVATGDGKYAVALPEERFLGAITGYTIGVPVWPPDPGVGN